MASLWDYCRSIVHIAGMIFVPSIGYQNIIRVLEIIREGYIMAKCEYCEREVERLREYCGDMICEMCYHCAAVIEENMY